MKISVIIPVFNASKYLDKCIDSLLSQTIDLIEIIFVDDCSTDNSLQILKKRVSEFSNKGYEIKIVEHKVNRGSASARNSGLERVTGKYIGWLDADDYIDPHMFEKLFDQVESENADIICCNFKMVYVDRVLNRPQPMPADPLTFVEMLMVGKMQGMLWNKLFRTTLFTENNIQFVDGANLAEDRNVLIKLLLCANSISFNNEYLYYYVQENSQSITRDLRISRVYEEITNSKDIIEFIESRNFQIDRDALRHLLFRSKSKLLHSKNIIDFKNWATIFQDSNDLVSNSSLSPRHKFLAICATFKFWGIIKIWIWLKIKLGSRSKEK